MRMTRIVGAESSAGDRVIIEIMVDMLCVGCFSTLLEQTQEIGYEDDADCWC